MSLTPTLTTPGDVLAKMSREQARALINNEPIIVADHLYNFCITSLALRDHLLEHLGKVSKRERAETLKSWNFPGEVLAAHDIGNSSKHLTLRDSRTKAIKKTTAKTIKTTPAQRKYVSVGKNGIPKTTIVRSVDFIIIIGKSKFDLWDFLSTVREFWEALLTAESIPYEKLPHREQLPLTT